MKELIVDRDNDETTLVNNTESSHTNASSLSLLLSKGEEEEEEEDNNNNNNNNNTKNIDDDDEVNNFEKKIVFPKSPRQVAGNSHKHCRYGRVDPIGNFYKPTDDTRKGLTELEFYENWINKEQRLRPEFISFLPTFFARTLLFESAIAEEKMPFLKLQDITAEMKEANVVDIKIGARTWHPSHDQHYREKRHRGDLETTSSSLGFRVCGMLTYEEESQTEKYWNRKWAKALTLESTMIGLNVFFGQNSERINITLQKLKEIRKSLEQNPFPVFFLGSSILICYDSSDSSADVRVVVVDFCNAVKNEAREVDANFLDGLISLTNLIENIAKRRVSTEIKPNTPSPSTSEV
jgi:hypothetical protein